MKEIQALTLWKVKQKNKGGKNAISKIKMGV